MPYNTLIHIKPMTNLSTQAQAIVGVISTTIDKPMNRIEVATAVLRFLIDECSEVRGTGRVDKKSQVVSVKTLMELATELEAMEFFESEVERINKLFNYPAEQLKESV